MGMVEKEVRRRWSADNREDDTRQRREDMLKKHDCLLRKHIALGAG